MINIERSTISLAGVLASLLVASPAGAWVHAGGGGGYGSARHRIITPATPSYGAVSSTHTGAYGGTTTRTATGSATTNPNGSTSYSGSEHTTYTAPMDNGPVDQDDQWGRLRRIDAGLSHDHREHQQRGVLRGLSYDLCHHRRTTAYHSSYYGTTAYPAYHPPTTVNVYGSSCYNCGGWSSAGAAAAGVAVGVAVGATVASANTAAATANAYNAGVAAGAVRRSPWARSMRPYRRRGRDERLRPELLPRRQHVVSSGHIGANGVYYRVVAAP